MQPYPYYEKKRRGELSSLITASTAPVAAANQASVRVGATTIYFPLSCRDELTVTCALPRAVFCTIVHDGREQAYLVYMAGDAPCVVPLTLAPQSPVLQVHVAHETCDEDGSYICVATIAEASGVQRRATILLLTEEGVRCEPFRSAATAEGAVGAADTRAPGCAAAA